jgi:hypothetical protein
MDAQKSFFNPPVDYRPAPLWVWNDELTPQRVRGQLREFHRAGMGGAFVHPRPGLISESRAGLVEMLGCRVG